MLIGYTGDQTEPAVATAQTDTSIAIEDGDAPAPAPAPAASTSITGDAAEDSYPELEDHITLQPPPPPPHPPAGLKPYFTLLEDRITGEQHHPTVHYIFADDDPDLLTNAALETLLHTPHHHQQQQPDAEVASTERFMLVDMSADGQDIVSTSSLSADWQSFESSLAQAPSWGNDSASTQLMLRISGQGSLPVLRRGRGDQRRMDDVAGLTRLLDDVQMDLESVVVGNAGHTTQ